MEISNSGNKITIVGNIKSVSDYQKIKSSIDNVLLGNDSIDVVIQDSLSITSSVVGYFNKIVLKDKVKLKMYIGNDQLVDLLDDLSLVSLFNVKKI